MHKADDKHIFAVYVSDVLAKQKIFAGTTVTIIDEEIIHRILNVLRMPIGHKLILFDEKNNYLATLAETKKNKAITLDVHDIASNVKPKLDIEFVLPLLKKEALEETIYSLTEIGVSSISLVTSAKSQKDLIESQMIRLHKMKVAAAEQSKNFSMPTISKPISFEKFCTQFGDNAKTALLFDPLGKSAFEMITQLQQQKIKKIACLIGPEGGLIQSEVQLAHQIGFVSCKLTDTVLRAVQAAAVGAGLVSSLL
jgi:16S rRNA (uracil1498-N3)-methyltransferase